MVGESYDQEALGYRAAGVQLAAIQGLVWGGTGPRDGDGSGVALVPSRTPRSLTVPCIGAVPTWGASVGTAPRPSGLAAPWACRKRQTRMHACSRTLQVGLMRSMSVSVSGVCRVGVWDAVCVDSLPGPL